MKKIRWIIQENLIAENDLKQMQQVLKEENVEFEEIKVIPFSGELPVFTVDDVENIYYGATTLMNKIYELYYNPLGLFYNHETFSMKNYIEKWGEHMLSSGAKTTTFGEFLKEGHPYDSLWFIRPDADDKSFEGQVREFGSIEEWIEVLNCQDIVELGEDTKIIAGEPYNIKLEWRLFMVEGKVVTATQYRKNFRLSKKPGAPQNVIDFAEARCKEYMPHDIFAMDIALCGDGYYIIECGCMNSVGFYHADIRKYIKAINNYVKNKTMSESKICCKTFEQQLLNLCEDHGFNCADNVLRLYRQTEGFLEIGIPHHDKTSHFKINFCPFCGTKIHKDVYEEIGERREEIWNNRDLKKKRIPVNIWDDFIEDGYVPTGKTQNTYAYVEDSEFSQEKRKEYLEFVLKHINENMDLDGATRKMYFYDSAEKYPELAKVEGAVMFKRWEIRFNNFSHKTLGRVLEQLQAAKLEMDGMPFDFYSES